MKIRNQLIVIFSILMVSIIITTSQASLYYTENAVIDSEIQQMKNILTNKIQQVETLNDRASEDIVFALKNPLFVEYFELPETKAGNVYKDGTIQFTENQDQIKTKLEQWIYHFQNKFSVDETCLIDTTGQEHARLVLRGIAPDDDLSPEEASAPFFEPSFQKNINEVHIQYPYVSPDTNRWVFAYTSPVVLGDGQKPAFYHFEMPITVFQEIVEIDIGRMYVVDPQGFIIADSKDDSVANAKYNVSPITITDFVPKDYFPSIQEVSATSEYNSAFENMLSSKDGHVIYHDDGNEYHIVFEELSTFGWILVYEIPTSLMLIGDTTLDDLRNTVLIISLITIAVGLVGIIVLSSSISQSIISLKKATNSISDGMLDIKIQSKGPNEIQELSTSFSNMAKSLKKTIQLEKDLAISEQKIKNEKLTAIGHLGSRMAHDIRNPLAVIKATVDLMKVKPSKDDKETQERIARINESIKRIERQTDTVLNYVKTKPLEIQVKPVMAIIDDAIATMIIPDNIKINKPDVDIEIRCDPHLILIAFLNLITNAIQAIGDQKGEINISITDQVEKVMIQIEDSGPGIPDDFLAKIFDPLFTTKQEGTGLGLSSCKTIIKQHGGTINIYNDPTRFVIKLPKEITLETTDIQS